MKYLIIGIFVFLEINGCTLSKDDILQSDLKNDISVYIDSTSSNIKYLSNYKMYLIRDTNDIYDQKPFYIGRFDHLIISKDSLKSPFWVLFKKWSPKNDTVYETKPLLLAINVPDNALTLNLKLPTDIQLIKRKSVINLDSINIKLSDYDTFYGDNSRLDDAVSNNLPDFYFTLNDFYTSSKTDNIDLENKLITVNLKKLTFSENKPEIVLSCYDYDFNCSPDDFMFSINFQIFPLFIPTEIVSLSKPIKLMVSNYSDNYAILYFKIR